MCLLKNSIFTLPLPKNRFAVSLNMFWFHVELSFCPKVFSNGLTLQKSVINDFKNSKEKEQLIIPEWLFDQRESFV